MDSETGELSGSRIGDKSDKYFLLGANFRVDDIFKGLYLNCRCSNLLDKEVRYPTSPRNNLFSSKYTSILVRILAGFSSFPILTGSRMNPLSSVPS